MFPRTLALDERIGWVFTDLKPCALQTGDIVDNFIIEEKLLFGADFLWVNDSCHKILLITS